ncbi:MAG: ABC transporter ATP-binding protein, partial [Brevefilum sp.]
AAMLHCPKMLLIDEFLIVQDMANAHRWMDFFKQFSSSGGTVLLAIHHPELTMKYCDRLIFLENGRAIINDETTTAFNKLTGFNYHAFLPQKEWELAYA